MKIIEGNVATLPRCVHVEQDGSYFFLLEIQRTDADTYVPALAVLDAEILNCEMSFIHGDNRPAEKARELVTAFLTSHGITATYDC